MSLTLKNFTYKVISVIDTRPQSFGENINYKSNDLKSIIRFCLIKTKNDLSFSLHSKNNGNVNYIKTSKIANCIGYTNYYNSLLKRCLFENKIVNIEISHVRALVYLNGVNLHQFSDDPSLKDHDISVIKNKKTGETFYVDASLSEVFGNIIIN
jgi:hypothetical protein